MRLDTFLSELNSHQKRDENPNVINADGSDALLVEYNGLDNTIVIYFEDSTTPIPVEDEVEMHFKGLDIPNEQVELEQL